MIKNIFFKQKFSNAISQKWKVKSKLVDFSLSSKLHPMRIKFENVWVVNELNLMIFLNEKMLPIFNKY